MSLDIFTPSGQGNPKKSRPVRFNDATQGPQDSAVKFNRGLEHGLNTFKLALAPPAPGVEGSFDRQHRGPSLPSIGPVLQAHAGAAQPDIGSIPFQYTGKRIYVYRLPRLLRMYC